MLFLLQLSLVTTTRFPPCCSCLFVNYCAELNCMDFLFLNCYILLYSNLKTFDFIWLQYNSTIHGRMIQFLPLICLFRLLKQWTKIASVQSIGTLGPLHSFHSVFNQAEGIETQVMISRKMNL